MLDHADLDRLYGPWRPNTVDDVHELMSGFPDRWWIAGGCAIEAFTGVRRVHDDVDLSIPRSSVPTLRRFLSGRLDVWAADRGSLTPLLDDAWSPISPTCGNLWLRCSGAEPWEFDVILENTVSPTWIYKRDERVSRSSAELLWHLDGIDYVRPEIQLLYKSRAVRPKDQADFDACLPLLAPAERDWLRLALKVVEPSHPWIASLR